MSFTSFHLLAKNKIGRVFATWIFFLILCPFCIGASQEYFKRTIIFVFYGLQNEVSHDKSVFKVLTLNNRYLEMDDKA